MKLHLSGIVDCWCTAKQVDNDYHKLHHLLLVEEFKKCLQSDVKMYLDEQKADSLHQAAGLADDPQDYFSIKSEQLEARSDVSDHKSTETGRHSPPFTRSRNHGQDRGGHVDYPRVLAGGPVCYIARNMVTLWLNVELWSKRMLPRNLML